MGSRKRRKYKRGGSDHAYQQQYSRGRRQFKSRRQAGWGMNLYRNTRDGKIGGVAAGLADHWDVAHWVVRLLWVGAFLFTGTLALWVYLGAWVGLAPRPRRRPMDADTGTAEPAYEDEFEEVPMDMEYDENRHAYRPRKVFRYSEPGSERLKRARDRLDAALARVENVEAYVTSRQYNLNQEFSKL